MMLIVNVRAVRRYMAFEIVLTELHLGYSSGFHPAGKPETISVETRDFYTTEEGKNY
jgi:hypothetical protein